MSQNTRNARHIQPSMHTDSRSARHITSCDQRRSNQNQPSVYFQSHPAAPSIRTHMHNPHDSVSAPLHTPSQHPVPLFMARTCRTTPSSAACQPNMFEITTQQENPFVRLCARPAATGISFSNGIPPPTYPRKARLGYFTHPSSSSGVPLRGVDSRNDHERRER